MPSEQLIIDRHISIAGQTVPTLEKSIATALKHNIAYQTARLNLKVTERALITARNARKWSLNMASSVTEGSERSGLGLPITNLATNPTLALSLSVPIDDIASKQGVVSAEIAIKDAKLMLVQNKEDLIRQVMTQWYSIVNLKQQVGIAKKAIALQETTLRNTQLKLKYGRAPMIDLNILETQLLTSRINLISTKLGYLNALSSFYQTLGLTLSQSHVKLRY
jgi:outer membrane protein TolC